MKRILVLRGGALGDFIVTLPALRALRERWPAARIELAGNARAAALGLLAGWLDAVHSQQEARWSRLYGTEPLAPDFRDWLASFDTIISFWPDPDGDLQRHLGGLGPHLVLSSAAVNTRPAAAHFCSALEPLGVHETRHSVRLAMPPVIQSEAGRRLAGLADFTAMHPGSGSPLKNWPRGRWSELAARLRTPLLAITGEADRDTPVWQPSAGVLHAHDWPLPVLAAALARCRCFIGHDSGISHLAAASGARCVTLFGPTDPAVWAPPGARVVRRGPDPASISVEDVLAALPAS